MKALLEAAGRLDEIASPRFDDPEWVSWEAVKRLTRSAPPSERQALLEEDNPNMRMRGVYEVIGRLANAQAYEASQERSE